MKLSRRGLYALRALLHLAGRWGQAAVPVHEIAAAEGIPAKFLEGILVTLKNARVVSSLRGREGGYVLARPPAEIRIGDLVRLLDGPLAPLGNLAELTHLVATEPTHAGLFDLLLDVRNAAAELLDNTSLADVLERDQRILAARRDGRVPGRARPRKPNRRVP